LTMEDKPGVDKYRFRDNALILRYSDPGDGDSLALAIL
jgi:hypothetical protein